MRKPDKKETVNLFFSAFLILAFIVCAHFFTQFTANLDATLGTIINICIYAVFGLLVFYATRVGDGKPVKRFSPVTLIVMVLPSLYIMIASVAKFMLSQRSRLSLSATAFLTHSSAALSLPVRTRRKRLPRFSRAELRLISSKIQRNPLARHLKKQMKLLTKLLTKLPTRQTARLRKIQRNNSGYSGQA